VENPVVKRLLGRTRGRSVDIIRMDLEAIGLGEMDFIDLAQDRDKWTVVLNTIMNFRVP
jgi:hypothetical protein